MRTAKIGQKTLILLMALLLSLSADANAKGKAKAKPFKLNGNGLWPNVGLALTPEGATFSGTANATHLGKVQQSGVLFLFANPFETGSAPGAGSVVLVAANGDKVFFDYAGVLELFLEEGRAVGSGTLTFTGGTGRFAGASGEAEFVANFDISDGDLVDVPMLVTIDGAISY